jgi:hypothetical protein
VSPASLNEEQWKEVVSYVLARLKDEQSFEIDRFEFVRMFGLWEGYYALIGEFWHRDKPSFSIHSPWKTTHNQPGGNMRLAREER